MDQPPDLPGLGAPLVLLAWLGREIIGWLKGRRGESASARATDAGADKTIGENWSAFASQLSAQLRKEMEDREELCDQRIAVAVSVARSELEEHILKLSSIVYALFKGKPLDPKQKLLLEKIAPPTDADAA